MTKTPVDTFVALKQQLILRFDRKDERECAKFSVNDDGYLIVNVQNTKLDANEASELGRWLIESYGEFQ